MLATALVAHADSLRADQPNVDPARIRAAAFKALERIRPGAANYIRQRDCFSCHHQALPMITMARAARAGLPVEQSDIDAQIDFATNWYVPKLDAIRKGDAVPSGAIEAGYAAWALAEAATGNEPADAIRTALGNFLLARQRDDGHWPAIHRRPPFEASPFTATAMALVGLDRLDESHRTGLTSLAMAAGADWLRRGEPEDTEDAAMRLWGLSAAGLSESELEPDRDRLLALQRNDGGWAQKPDMQSDAYATGQALFVLAETGLPVDSPAYQRGLSYLLAAQSDDGAWLVETRAQPLRVFFDNGDPGGKSQFISFAATNWATLALLHALSPKHPAVSQTSR